MWSTEQRQRLYLEHQVLQREEFTQFSVYHDQSNDTYYACGYASSSSGRRYRLYITIPSGYPDQRPSMYITDPLPLLMRDGTKLTDLGTSHYSRPRTEWFRSATGAMRDGIREFSFIRFS